LPHNEALAAAKGSIILNSSAGLGSVAASEGRSVAQVCEAFLQAGLVAYEKEGSKYVSRYLASHEVGKEK
jgi:hypothetical protein